MPTYEYHCDACEHDFEAFQSMKDDPLTDCPECGKGEVRRLIGTGAALIFKGSGFYETDYKTKSGSSDSKSSSSSETKSETKKDTSSSSKPAEKKSSD